MSLQWAGALLVIAGCGVFGFSMAGDYICQELSLRQLIGALDYMFCELQYSAAPLPQICRKIGEETRGNLGKIFAALAEELETASGPNVMGCMEVAIGSGGPVLNLTDKYLRELAFVLGRFDLDGQLRALEGVRNQCRAALEEWTKDRPTRVRSYETLGICAGAALAIILV